MIEQIPVGEFRKHFVQARASWTWGEVGGVFYRIPGREGGMPFVRYMPAANVTKFDRMKNIEIDSAWIADMNDRGYEAVAMIHSHPGGEPNPSPLDVEMFPTWLVRTGFVFYGDGGRLTQYNEQGVIRSAVRTDRSVAVEM